MIDATGQGGEYANSMGGGNASHAVIWPRLLLILRCGKEEEQLCKRQQLIRAVLTLYAQKGIF